MSHEGGGSITVLAIDARPAGSSALHHVAGVPAAGGGVKLQRAETVAATRPLAARRNMCSLRPTSIPWLVTLSLAGVACSGAATAVADETGSTGPSASDSETDAVDGSSTDATGSGDESGGTDTGVVDGSSDEGSSTGLGESVTDGTSSGDASSGPADTGTSTGDVAACGDGVVDVGEACDDAGESASCNADCSPASCGDGVVNLAAGEACDDAAESVGCDTDCSLAECGDAIRNVTAGEQCDGLDVAGAVCLDHGFTGGVVTCDAACALDIGTCDFTPAPPSLELSFSQVRRFDFAWAPAPGAEYYLLLERAAPGEELVQLGTEIAGLATSIERPLAFRVEASYVLRACNDLGCADSPEVEVGDALTDAIGYFKASNTDEDDRFGFGLALSGDGRTLAVGAIGEASAASGVGADQSSNDLPDAGAIFVFVRDDGGGWSQQAYIKASDPESGWFFGQYLALDDDGDTLAVGVPNDHADTAGIEGTEIGGGPHSGAAYVFVRDVNDVWSQQVFIKASDAAPSGLLGQSPALTPDGDVLAVGASDAVYVFVRDENDQWSERDRVAAPNDGVGFGSAVVLIDDGDTLVVGAPREDSDADGIDGDADDESAAHAGAVYVFERTMGQWWQQAYIKASNSDAYDGFGGAIAVSDDGRTLAVGASGERSSATGIDGDQGDNSIYQAGAVYVFDRDPIDGWSQQAYVKASNTGSDFFGTVALDASGDILVVGASSEDSDNVGLGGDGQDDTSTSAGAAHVYRRDAQGAWSPVTYVKAPNTHAFCHFGSEVAISGDGQTIAIAAPWESGAGMGIASDGDDLTRPDAGAVYVY